MKTKISARYVIVSEGDEPVVYRNSSVVYEDDVIIFVGSDYPGEVDRSIDAGNAIISPGFIDLDALGDIDHAILDAWGSPEITKGLEWSEEYFSSTRVNIFSDEEEALRRRYAFVQLLLNGVTTALPIAGEYHKEWAETYDEFAKMAEIAAELGLRVYLGPSYRSGVPATRNNGEPDVLWAEHRGIEGLEAAVRFVKDFDGKFGGLVKGMLAPARIQTCTIDLLKQTIAFGDELDCPVRLHACQDDTEVRLIRKWFDKTPLELLSEIGFLKPRTLLPHATHLRGRHPSIPGPGDELPMLSASGATVVHCPVIEARYGAVLRSFESYQKAGVNMALGTDTFPPDMIRVMDLTWNLNKILEGNQWSLDPGEIFKAATIYGAKALGRDDLGRIAPGAKADLIVVDLNSLRVGPVEDPIRTLILHTTGRDIKTVIINGRTVVTDGKIPGVDLDDLRDRGQAYFEKMKAAYSRRDYLKRPPEALFPPVFRTV